MFRLGDEVVIVRSFVQSGSVIKAGWKAKLVCTQGSRRQYGMEFLEVYCDWMHGCSGHAERPRGFWIDKDLLELYARPCTNEPTWEL